MTSKEFWAVFCGFPISVKIYFVVLSKMMVFLWIMLNRLKRC
jgi:hypothetical protein